MQGQVFSQDFLPLGILETPPLQAPDEPAFIKFESAKRSIYAGLNA
jgi:hypothetical protein